MSMLLLMPWCPIHKCYESGEISILPFRRHASIDGLDKAAQSQINTIVGMYKNIEGKPVHKAAIIRFGEKSLIDDRMDNEIDNAQELAVLVCFSGLAGREYFNALGPYCNSDFFSLYVQKFSKADFTALTTRRREGHTLGGWSIDDISITIPVHCHTIREVSLDADLLMALVNHRAQQNCSEWGRWQNAISCFNQANTDSDNIRYQMEWVLLCSAFEHLLSAQSKAKDVAHKFSQAVVPSNELLAKDSNRLAQRPNGGESIRSAWMKEFYRIRGDFAHGQLNTKQFSAWEPLEHLVLSTIAFPLLIKNLLSRVGKYKLTDKDQAQIDCLEQLADTKDFLKPPSNQAGSLDSHWGRLVRKRCSKISIEHAVDNLRNLRKSAHTEQMNDESSMENQ